MEQIQILVVDLGSQYSLVIGRTLREIGFRSAILSPKKAGGWLKANQPKAIILSGGDKSVNDEDAPSPPGDILKLKIPILGICYGMQWMAKALGGSVAPKQRNSEFGRVEIAFETNDPLFSGIIKKRYNVVWASHGDSVLTPPPEFTFTAMSKNDYTFAAMSNPAKKMYGLLFHPEVPQTPKGKQILKRFVKEIAQCQEDWKPQNMLCDIQSDILQTVGQLKKCIIGFSGGVDSTTLSAILAPVLKERLLAVCIDTGALRQNEIQEIRQNALSAGVRLKIVKVAGRFQKALGNTIRAEVKRKRFSKLYGKILDEEASLFGAGYALQGSLATDFIESARAGESALIKSHHNTNLKIKTPQLHPFRNIFKYEVRELAKVSGLPHSVVERQPFPGPALIIRVVGTPPRPDKLAIVRWADAQVTEILKKRGLYKKISQLVVGFVAVPLVGVKGDARVYGPSIAIRAVESTDFMTAKGVHFSKAVEDEITSVITKHPKIVHAMFLPADKPPATVELE